MCCGRRNNNKTNFWAVAQQVLSRPVVTSSVNTGEPLGPPPAYEHVEHQSIKLGKNKDTSTTALVEKHNPPSIRSVPQYTSVDPLVDSSLNNTSSHATKSTCQSRCAAKRERKNEQRQLKREYRQEMRELRAEYRNEKKEMRKSSVNSLLNGVSNLMK
ncbi:hypothetical protein D6C87_09046 [Aureobasidium pullulans]|uniref:BZIP domain-containing protein n=1 Tax=Aureobasidium pullulans TaxID=5580 RepID=A0AB38LMT4_AURPU|nr:hypothetical protein D6C94_08957 [Aureobasidium pullulans]THZ36619.1 hypothetical protein D6C87_09046 [Aureobasidium pullulans]THZ72042.1 hypothetical protein D6C88_07369 [Aureobasidium pullulans]